VRRKRIEQLTVRQQVFMARARRFPLRGLSEDEQGEIIMRRTSRREAVKFIAAAGAGILAAPFLNKGRYLLFAGSPAEYSSRAIELVGRTTVIDMLSPFAISPSRTMQLFGHPETFTPSDLEQFRSSGIRLFHIAIGNGGTMPIPKACSFSDYGMASSLITDKT